MRHLEITVFGAVQGVGFRFYAREKANALNLNGFAKNNRDGTVTLEVEGQEEDLEKFAAWCRGGPNSVKVEKIEIQEGALRNFHDFECL